MYDDTRTVREIEQDLCKGYELEHHEKQSLKEIESMLSSRAYHDSNVIQDHRDFLEHLLFKLHNICTDEAREGFSTVGLEADIAHVQHLLKRLTNLLYAVDSDLHFSLALPTHRFKYA